MFVGFAVVFRFVVLVGIAALDGLVALGSLSVLQSLRLGVVLALHVLELLGLFLIELLYLLLVRVRLALDFLLLLNLALFQFLAFGVLLSAQLFKLLLLLLLHLRVGDRNVVGTIVWRATIEVTVVPCRRAGLRLIRILILRSNAGRRLIWTRGVGIRGIVDGLAVVHGLSWTRSVVVHGGLVRNRLPSARRVVFEARLTGLTGTAGGVSRLGLNRRDGASDRRDTHVVSRRAGGGPGCGLRWRRRELAILCASDRTASVGLDGGFLAVDGDRSGRRRSLRDDGARSDGGRRTDGCRATSADKGLAIGSDRGSAGDDARLHDFALIDADEVARYVLTGDESVAGGGGDGALVDVGHVSDVDLFIHDDGGVVIVDDGAFDARVRDVDVFAVAAAHRVRRHVDFTRTKWEPADVGADGDAEVRTADPGDERGSVNGANVGNADDRRGAGTQPQTPPTVTQRP